MKFDKKTLDALKAKGLINDHTHATIMALGDKVPHMSEGGKVPAALDPDYQPPQDVVDQAIMQKIDASEPQAAAADSAPAQAPQDWTSKISHVMNSAAEPFAQPIYGAITGDKRPGSFLEHMDATMAPSNQPQLAGPGSAPAAPSGPIQPAVASGGAPQAGNIKLASDGQLQNRSMQNPLASQFGSDIPMMGDVYKGTTAAYDQAGEGMSTVAGAQQKAALEDAHTLSDMKTQLQQKEAVRAVAEDRRQDLMIKAEDSFKDGIEKFNKLQVDPNNFKKNFYANASTGQKLLAGIGLILGGFGSGGNQAVKVLEGAIDRDISAQKANIDKAGVGLNAQKSLLGEMRMRFGDERMSEIAARRAMMEQAELQLKQTAAKYKSPEIAGALQQGLAGIELKKNEYKQAMASRIFELSQISQATGGGGTGGAMGISNPAYLDKEIQKKMAKMPDGTWRMAGSEEGAKEINKIAINGTEIKHTIDRLRQLQKDAGRSIPWTDASAEAKALNSRLMFQNQQLEGINRLSEPDIHLLQQQMADPTAFRQDRTTKLLNQFDDHINNKLDTIYRQHLIGGAPRRLDIKEPVKNGR
jgi:hypothetical protein